MHTQTFIILGLFVLYTVSEYYSIDGTYNNLVNPEMGSYSRYFSRRNMPAEFEDGVKQPVERGLFANPRHLSNVFGGSDSPALNEQDINMLEAFFGQFINHDLENTKRREDVVSDYRTPLPTVAGGFPEDDPLYDPNSEKDFIITRDSVSELVNGVTEVRNNATSWLDLSNIYGSTQEHVEGLRSHVGGKMKTQDYSYQPFGPAGPTIEFNNFPPTHDNMPENERIPNNTPRDLYFGAGDGRINENVGLMTFQILFLREHNRIATELEAQNPSWDDETLFQEARRLNIAVYQHLVFDEYLAVILGDGSQRYKPEDYCYDPTIDTDTSYIFASAAFRYGHSTVNLWDLTNSGPDGECPHFYRDFAGNLDSKLAFAGQMGGPLNPLFTMSLCTTFRGIGFANDGLDNILRGLLRTKSDRVDLTFSDSIRNVVTPGLTGAAIDLFLADVQRGRINGLPNYHEIRKAYGMNVRRFKNDIYSKRGCDEFSPEDDPLRCFKYITKDRALARKLRDTYGKVKNIDAIVGMLAEKKKDKHFMPPTMGRVILEEYERKRNGDRLWYEGPDAGFSADEIALIKSRSLADVLRDNGYDNVFIQDDALLMANPEDVAPCTL